MGVKLPDETALVIYRDQASYDTIRGTPEGQLYGPLHFKLDGVKDIPGMAALEGRDFFVRDDGAGHRSGSAVAQAEVGRVEFGQAYAPVVGTEAMWQSASVLFHAYVRKPGLTDEQYLAGVTAYLQASASGRSGLQWHVMRVEKDYVLEYWGMDDDWGYGEANELKDSLLAPVADRIGNTVPMYDLTDEQSRARDFPIHRGMGFKVLFKTGQN
jgi:hypothetical protein